jgi:hypothetical protein
VASKPGDLILDPFGGSGTTGKVAMELERRSVLPDRNFTGEGGYEMLARWNACTTVQLLQRIHLHVTDSDHDG